METERGAREKNSVSEETGEKGEAMKDGKEINRDRERREGLTSDRARGGLGERIKIKVIHKKRCRVREETFRTGSGGKRERLKRLNRQGEGGGKGQKSENETANDEKRDMAIIWSREGDGEINPSLTLIEHHVKVRASTDKIKDRSERKP